MPARPPDRAAFLKSAAVPALLSVAFLILWLSLPDKTFVFDGVQFSGVVERAADDWRVSLWNRRHLIFNPFFLLLRDALGDRIGAYRLFQLVNAAAGPAGLLLFGGLIRRLTRDAALGWTAALLLGATWCYGTRATEGQVYMLMSLGAIAVLWSCARLLERPSAPRAAAAVALFVPAVLFHAANACLLPALLAALWLAFPRRPAAAAAGGAAAIAACAAPYLLVFRGEDAGGYAALAGNLHAPSLAAVWRETGAAILALPDGAALTAGLLLWLAAAGAVAASWRVLDGERRGAAVVIGLAWAGFTAVNLFWPGGLFFYVPPHACALALLALAAGPRWSAHAPPARRRALGALVFSGLALAAWNAVQGLVPQSRIENSAGYEEAQFVGRHTVEDSWILLTGLGIPNSKIYLPSFAHRRLRILELYFLGMPKDRALSEIAGFVSEQSARGVPIYFLSDLLEDRGVRAQMKSLWDVGPADVQRAVGRGRLVKLAASPGASVYLFVPLERQPELFAGLGSSVLRENDPERLQESAGALRQIAQWMTPPERRRAAELMRSTDWGMDMVWAGLSEYMSPETKAVEADRKRHFAEWKNGPQFWVTAGNLYNLLDMKAEALDAWTRAQRISGDAGLLKSIEALRKR